MNLKAMAVVASGVVASIASGDAIQWRVQDGGNGHWYELRSDPLIWTAARVEAQTMGGDLVALETVAELEWVRSRVPAAYFLAGGVQDPNASQVGSGWRWVTGIAIEGFSVSFDDNPCGASGSMMEDGQQDYVEIVGAVIGDINAGRQPNCSDVGARQFIVEWSADCNNDGIVDYGQCRDGTLPDFNGNNIPDCCEQGTACTVGSYPVEWRVADGGNGHWYQLIQNESSLCWSEANARATGKGGTLVSETSLAEHQFVSGRLVSRAAAWSGRWGPWIGARFTGGAWGWSSGEPWTFAAWYPGEPNGGGNEPVVSYIAMGEGGGCGRTTTWNDWIDCGTVQPSGCDVGVWNYIIEWSADCNNDGIVDYGQILSGELPDANPNGVPDNCECLADLNGDGAVAGEDLAAVLNNWGTKGGVIDADVNNDGIVDGSDLSIVLNGWGACP